MAVEETSGVDVEEGVGVEVVGGVVLEEVDKGVDEVLSIEEERVLEVSGVLLETGGELLLAIELDGGTEVLVGDDGVWVDVVGTPVSVLVELVDMVNCLLNTSFLGRLYVAMSAKRNLIMVGCHHVYLQHSRRVRCIIPQAWIDLCQCSSDSACFGEGRSDDVSCLERASDVLLAGLLLRFHWWADGRGPLG
jgi:hypothetical protein